MIATTAASLYESLLAPAATRNLREQDLISSDAPAARPLVTVSFDTADGYEIPLPTLSRLPKRQRQVRCNEDGGAAPMAVYAFLVIVSVAAATWNSWMAMKNVLVVEQLREEAAARCQRLAPSDRRILAAAVRQMGSDGSNVCMIGAAELLQQALQVGREATSTISPGTRQQKIAVYSQPNRQKGEARTLAHLGSDYYPNPEPDLSNANLDRWLNESRYGSLVMGNLSRAGGGITIGESGYYFIYSQVSFVLAALDAVEVSPFTDHKLMRRRAGRDLSDGGGNVEQDLLARAQNTRCWSSKSNCSLSTSYVGAVYRLDKGDVVTVGVDQVRHVWHNPQWTFIGAYLLST